MSTPSFTVATILRDPFLIKHLNEIAFRENLHRGFLQLALLIRTVFGPDTPEPETPPTRSVKAKPKLKPRKSWRKTSVAKAPEKKYQTLLLKYKNNDKGKKNIKGKPVKDTKKAKGKESLKLPSIKKSKEEPEYGKQRVRYLFKYSQSFDLYKHQQYIDLLKTMGEDIDALGLGDIDLTMLDDPDLVEVNLAWCRIGTFIEEAQAAASVVTTPVDGSTPMVASRPASRRSVISAIGDRSDDTPTKKEDFRGSTIPKLPPIGEH